ncbi:PREDICTED: myosin-6-like [Cyprinodon variegatus]|uniref:myosin-6-like n=1 Tax=Cyprinodon variegatus TaxID=28743 RepID=UPI000742C7B8|nr:PREDICTED: myosin-6-like [Cyprinodon variegatus]
MTSRGKSRKYHSLHDDFEDANGTKVESGPEPESEDLDWDCYSTTLEHRLAAEQENVQASEQRCAELEKARRELERQLSGLSDRLEEEEVCSAQLVLHRDRLEAECGSLRRDLDDLESALTVAEQDKQLSDSEVRRLTEQLLQRDEALQKLQREKDHLVELSQQAIEDLQMEEDKVNLLTKEKTKLQLKAEDLEYQLERLQHGDPEKARRRQEADSREVEKMTSGLEDLIKRSV